MKKSIPALAVLFLFLISGCKYENGPALSLRSKTDRLTGQWHTEKILIDGEEWVGVSISYKFEDDGNYRRVFESGTWSFDDNKENIILYPSNSDSYKIHILRLTNNELWLEHTINDKMYEYFLAKEEKD